MPNDPIKFTIKNSMFENVVQEGAVISFSSSDDDYLVKCTNPNCDLSGDLPLTVPKDGNEVNMTINSNTKGKIYLLKVTNKKKSSDEDDDILRPVMIIKVE